MPDHVYGNVCGCAADIVELRCVVADPVCGKCLLRGNVLIGNGDGCPVPWRSFVEVIHGIDTRGAGHIRDRDGRISRDEAAKMLDGKLTVETVTTRWTGWNDHPYLLAGEDVRAVYRPHRS